MKHPNTKAFQSFLKVHHSILLILLVLSSHTVFAQQGTQKKADRLFDKYAFADAALTYKKLIDKNYNADYNTRQLADCYAFMRNPDSAVVYYQKVVEQENFPIAYYYNYAQALRGVEDFKGYRKNMRLFKKAGGFLNDENLQNDKDFLQIIFNAKQRYFLEPVSLNSIYSDFGAIENNGKIYFTSSRDRGAAVKHTYGWNNEPFLDIYAADSISEVSINHKNKIKGDVNTLFHEGTLTISKDGKTMYFSRNNFNDQVLGQDAEGISKLKIYKASLVDGKWTNVTELPFNSNRYSTSHPTLNADETKLYFASDRPSSYGGTDIFYVDINANRTYSKPVNLGPIVNTSKNERFPFINSEGILFFASDGHPGLGLMDIFGTVQDNNKKITEVFNLGVPVNSSKDDFSFFMNPDGLSGYFASNRNGGIGGDDIYAYKRVPPLKLEGIVTDDSNAPIANTTIKIYDSKETLLAQVFSDSVGNFEINIDRNADYNVLAEKDTYEAAMKFVTSKDISDTEKIISVDFVLNEEKIELPFTELYPIYFDFNKYNIRKESTKELDRIVNLLMNVYPNMIIKIESHTDSRGSANYNQRLSIERAQATYDYLISKGVLSDRISSYKGFGESQLVNDCDGTKQCTEKQHQLNRRTQFIILKMD
ncbi:OmpA family protein [Gaetbulibacter sp. M240]|uniref:OmpA family protein n=1 Tax=Gaetbulibacter sp. M240 TaxID=3126511 RepID=UPI00374FA894